MGVAWEGLERLRKKEGCGSRDEDWGWAWSHVDQTGQQEEDQGSKVIPPHPQEEANSKTIILQQLQRPQVGAWPHTRGCGQGVCH